MKSFIFTLIVFLSATTWAAPAAPEYNINVHVSASRMVIEGKSSAHQQSLSVVIDGKKYELESDTFPNSLLMLGDYKARLVRDDEGKGKYESWRVYELVFPDKKTRQYLVVGQSE